MNLLDHMYTLLGSDATLTALGVETRDMTRQFGAETKDPPLPRLAFSVDYEERQVFAPIDYVKLFISTYTKSAKEAEQITARVVAMLHLYTVATPNLTVYRCSLLGGPPQPIFVKDTNTWEVTAVFKIRFT